MPRAEALPAFLSRRRAEIGAFGLYGLASFLFMGLPLLERPGPSLVGQGSDPTLFAWDMGWWPHAILHGENPFVSHAIWAPDGVNLAWTTSVPAIAIVFSPLTLIAGPVAALNVANVLMPALSAFTAFLLCRYLTRAFWPALVGGYLFGLSSDILVHSEGAELHVSAAFVLPLVPLVLLRFLNGELGNVGLVVRLGILLAVQLLIGTELSLMLAVALVLSLALALLIFSGRRRQLVSLVPRVLAGYALAGVLTSPFLYFALSDFRTGPANPQDSYYSDLLSFVVPSRPSNYLLDFAYRGLHTRLAGPEAYLGLPVLLMVFLFVRLRGRTPEGRFLAAAFLAGVVLSLGPYLIVDGEKIGVLPWALVHNLAGFDNILTARFAIFVSLAAAAAGSLWLASRNAGVLRWALPVVAVVFLVPTVKVDAWAEAAGVPAFFTAGKYGSCLDPGETILPLPISDGESNLWQTEGGYRFAMAGGWFGQAFVPKSFLATPALAHVASGLRLSAAEAPAVRAFVAAKNIDAIVVDSKEIRAFQGALDAIATPRRVGGVVLYDLSPAAPPCAGA